MKADSSGSGFWIGVGGVATLWLAAALVAFRDSLSSADIALILVLPVVLAAASGGRAAGMWTAVVAALSFDFFFTRPYLSLTIDSRDDVVTTTTLLVVGLVVGHLGAAGRRARTSASRSSGEVRRIYRVAELAARGAHAEDVILGAQAELMELLRLRSCRFEAMPYPPPPNGEPPLPRMERSGIIDTTEHWLRAEGFELPARGVELPVLGRGQSLGRFVLTPTAETGVSLEEQVVAVAIADQVGAVLAAPKPDEKGGWDA